MVVAMVVAAVAVVLVLAAAAVVRRGVCRRRAQRAAGTDSGHTGLVEARRGEWGRAGDEPNWLSAYQQSGRHVDDDEWSRYRGRERESVLASLAGCVFGEEGEGERKGTLASAAQQASASGR